MPAEIYTIHVTHHRFINSFLFFSLEFSPHFSKVYIRALEGWPVIQEVWYANAHHRSFSHFILFGQGAVSRGNK